MALPTDEKTLLALLPTKRMVPTTITRITASITAYSAYPDLRLHATNYPRCSSCVLPSLLEPGLPLAGKLIRGISWQRPQGWQSGWTLEWLGRILRCRAVPVKRSESVKKLKKASQKRKFKTLLGDERIIVSLQPITYCLVNYTPNR